MTRTATRVLFSCTLIAAATLSACTASNTSRTPDLTSGLNIPAGETFNLGGEQRGNYNAEVTNRGSVAVEILSTTPGDSFNDDPISPTPVLITAVEPGASQRFSAGAGVPLLLRNTSDTRNATLKVEVWGDTNLAMFYTDNQE
ncbi:MAG: hypothetical protein AAGH64_02595 [Planctomycetota bacterium]